MGNLLEAIIRIHKLKNLAIEEFYKSRIRANNMGEALERFINDAFADTFDVANEEQRNIKYSEIFSYIANQNNPPD
ncbi:MAG: NgoPII family restriction endonuclease, partial [Treponema sp.]|nr:NgoPII family restriction endonuclease [Treponema sp.]